MEYITKLELFSLVKQDHPEYRLKDIQTIVNAFLESMEAQLVARNNLVINNLGKFETKQDKPKTYFDVHEKKLKKCQPHHRIQYHPAPNLRKSVR